jgi:UDP-N-acetylglucosamine 2-epimerase (non-hydrolysing)
MKKILIVFGTRPEAIKMVPVIKALKKRNKHFEVKICVTAQHREMLDQVLDIFNVTCDYDLNIMKSNQDLFDITSKVLLGLRDIFQIWLPDIVLVHGDTTTSMAASMAAFYFHIKIGHIEAGLRTGNLQAPWPEEMNRQVVDRICDFHFAPTNLAKQNLITEGINENNITVTGNTVIDTLFLSLSLIESDKKLFARIKDDIISKGYPIENQLSLNRKYILVTGHRRESFGQGFLNICKAIKDLALSYKDIDIVYPVHLNPNVRKPVYDILSGMDNIYLTEPIDYLPFTYLMKCSTLILSDSGGIQEEAPSLGKPVLVMRNITERQEGIDAGTALLVGTNYRSIFDKTCSLLNDSKIYRKMSKAHNPYGDGNAAETITKILINRKGVSE